MAAEVGSAQLVGQIASKGQLRMSFVRWALVIVPLIVLLGFLSGRSVPSGNESLWYQALAKPAITPPNWAFPVAWSILYVLIALALSLVLSARGARWRGIGIALFVAQFALNLAFSPMFFGLHLVKPTLLLLAGIVILAVLTAAVFARVRPLAAVLMLPYVAWVGFAGVLLWQIDVLNPGASTLVPPAASSHVLG